MFKKIIPLLAILLACGGGNKEGAQVVQPVDLTASEDWMGIYIKDTKIGYVYSRQETSGDTLRFIQKSTMKLEMLGTHEEFYTNLEVTADPKLNLIGFTFDISSEKTSFYAEGVRENDMVKVTVETAGEKETKEIPAKGELIAPPALGMWLLAQSPKPGGKFKVTILEPTLLKTVPVTIKTVGPDTLEINGIGIPALHVTTTMMAMTSDVWLDSTGTSIKEIQKPQIVMVRESKEEALAEIPAPAQLDLLSFFAVKTDDVIQNPRDLSELKLRIEGLDEEAELILSSPTQKITKTKGGVELTITAPDTSKIARSTRPSEEPAEFLSSSVYIQADNEKIRKKASEIVAGEQDAMNAAAKLVSWVHKNLKKRATASVPSAVEVLATKEGDCNEHAILIAALGRAAGIPTKINVGLVYLEGAFYYHAWNSFWIGGTWVPADATFGQLPADPTHVQLHEGELDEQARVIAIVGQIKIDILEER
ncbi:transglutaminase domain-containing protein [candidate division WOR-3 bacterium]|nr:transglutaminase domain-containing protein [candidate division WOR-3 bacterium]